MGITSIPRRVLNEFFLIELELGPIPRAAISFGGEANGPMALWSKGTWGGGETTRPGSGANGSRWRTGTGCRRKFGPGSKTLKQR